MFKFIDRELKIIKLKRENRSLKIKIYRLEKENIKLLKGYLVGEIFKIGLNICKKAKLI